MDIKITPRPLGGTVTVPLSKSHAHRLLIAGALAAFRGPALPYAEMLSAFWEDLESSDITVTRGCLAALFSKETPAFDCGESGSTLRFLLPVAAALRDECLFLGGGRLPERPLSPLKEEMEAHGCSFFFDRGAEECEGKRLICRISGRLKSGTYRLPGNVSSQFITGLLFALPLLDGDSRIVLTSRLESAGYVDMTLSVLKQAGIEVDIAEGAFPSYYIRGNQAYRQPEPFLPEGDWSGAAFWLTAGFLSRRSGLDVDCIGLNPASAQGDKAIRPLLDAFVREEGHREIDAADIPDLVPILAVAAALSPGVTEITGAGRLRIKESDRLASVTEGLSALGAQIQEHAEGLTIHGSPSLTGGTVSGHNDHRIVMAMAIASIGCKSPVLIRGAEAVRKSYPAFFKEFQVLGGCVDVV